MVAWNDDFTGERLGQLSSIGLALWCCGCRRTAYVRLDVALRLWGERTFARDIARDLRCTICGARKAEVQVITDTRLREAQIADPNGGFPWQSIDPPLSQAMLEAKKRGWL